jgi:hypothetical protein
VGGGGSGGSFQDMDVDPKAAYSWRIAAIVGGKVAGYSNTLSNTCKNPSQDSTLLIPPSGGSE